MKKLAVTVALGTIALGTLAALPAQAAAAQSCRGQAATLVVDGRGADVATHGRDVIVVLRGGVDALGGDDVICLQARATSAEAGPGDDVVDAQRARYSYVELGTGRDTFIGSPGRDSVDAGVDGDRDVVRTGDGKDTVVSGELLFAPDEGYLPSPDRISTGAGNDYVRIHTSDLDGSDVAVGRGDNVVYYNLSAPDGSTWTWDARTHRVVRGDSVGHFRGSEDTRFSFTATDDDEPGRFEFFGSADDDHVSVDSAGWITDLRLGAGDDSASTSDLLAGNRYTLGRGSDRLGLGALDAFVDGFDFSIQDDLHVDMAARTAGVGGRTADVTFGGVERLAATARQVRLNGSDAGDRITLSSCDVVAGGGAGPDRLVFSRFGIGETCGSTFAVRLLGGAGDDQLVGSDISDDVLVGGRGYDVADGRGDTDTCRAEVRRRCELF